MDNEVKDSFSLEDLDKLIDDDIKSEGVEVLDTEIKELEVSVEDTNEEDNKTVIESTMFQNLEIKPMDDVSTEINKEENKTDVSGEKDNLFKLVGIALLIVVLVVVCTIGWIALFKNI